MPQTKGGLSAAYLPETSMEAMEANEQYQEALARLTQALDARKNRVIDPVMMSVAAGFLGPTQTGSFGEAMGRVAEKLPGAIQAQEQEEQELAKAQLGAAQQNIALQRMRERDKTLGAFAKSRGLGGVPAGQTTLGGAPAGGLPKGPGAQPQGALSSAALNYLQAARFGNEDPATIIKNVIDMERGALKPTEGGMYNLDTGAFTPRPGMAPVQRQLYNYPDLGMVDISPALAAKHDQAIASGDPMRLLEIETQIVEGPSRPPAKPAGRVAPSDEEAIEDVDVVGRRPRLRSKAEIEAEAAKEKRLAEELGKTEGERQANVLAKGDAATASIQLADQLLEIATAPDAEDFLGVARQNDEMVAMIVNLLGTGVGLPGGMSVGLPELPATFMALRLTPDQMTRYQYFLQQAREMGIKMSEFAKGSVSNYEQTLFREASINENDLAGTVIMKAKAMKARAEFDKARADLLDTGRYKTIGQLKRSPEYQKLKRDLDQTYRSLLQDRGLLPKNAPNPSGVSLRADQIKAEREARGL